MLSCTVFVCLLFFNRPGIWKDLKTMGSVSLSIFFVTLLVLGRQVRSLIFCWFFLFGFVLFYISSLMYCINTLLGCLSCKQTLQHQNRLVQEKKWAAWGEGSDIDRRIKVSLFFPPQLANFANGSYVNYGSCYISKYMV